MTIRIINAHVLSGLRELPGESVQCVVTSPPYWGLRDYGIAPVVWDDPGGCEHEWGDPVISSANDSNRGSMEWTTGGDPGTKVMGKRVIQGQFCLRCSAWRGSLGLEPTPDLYVKHIVQVFREVRRVLRKDGVMWLNLGDSYAGYHGNSKVPDHEAPSNKPGYVENMRGTTVGLCGLKPKDLVGIPWRVAFALQADGWYLRSDIIWHKPNPMPESVRDRPTKAHEYLFLMSKSERYFYDAEAVKEPSKRPGEFPGGNYSGRNVDKMVNAGWLNKTGVPVNRNLRSVWTIATQPYREAHFATFPEKLVEPCILAGSREVDTVLDPFGGSGTVGAVAERLGRNAVIIEIKPEYCEMARRRTAQAALEFGG